MGTNVDIDDEPWGDCLIRPSTQEPMQTPARPDGVGTETFHWHPSPRLGMNFPGDKPFEVVLRRVVLNDGTRYFLPAASFSDFIARAQTAGLEILTREKDLSPAQSNTYGFNWLLYHHVHHMRSFIRRRFRNRRDLLLARSAQSTEGERDILPWPKYKTGSQNPRLPATVDELMTMGEQRASQDGMPRPTAQEKIQFGLLFAAESMPPLSPSESEILALIRAALFDVGSSPYILQNKQSDWVRERLAEAIGTHLNDTTDEFDKWLFGPNNSIIKQLAKQKKAVGGEFDRDIVRQALVELGWQAHAQVARLVEVLMIDFRKLIRPKLSKSELQIFSFLYLRNSYFGGLSLIMLAERLEFIGSHLWQLLHDPADPRLRSIFYRLLSFYSAMSESRRAADKLSKQRMRPNNRTCQMHENIQKQRHLKSDISDVRLTEIAANVCNKLGIRCGCARPDWSMTVTNTNGEGKYAATVACRNKSCKFSTNVRFSAADVR